MTNIWRSCNGGAATAGEESLMRFARDWKMTHSYNFSIIRLESDELRGERINIGALILKEVGIDLRLTRRMERVRAISAAVDLDSLNGLLGNLKGLDDLNRQSGITDPIERLNKISRVGRFHCQSRAPSSRIR